MTEEVHGGRGAAFVRADKIDLKSMDKQLEWHITRALTMERKQRENGGKLKYDELAEAPARQDWEIDAAKLVIKSVVSHGSNGTVHHGIYDGQDVGGRRQRTQAEIASLRGVFSQEVSVWQKLDHPNVTKFLGATMGGSETNIQKDNGPLELLRNVCCLVVEYLRGGTLKNFLIRNSREKLAFKVVIQLATDLARGLSYLHSLKIVHRDVKTENMLLDRNQTVKIADFGVARVEAVDPQEMTGETGTLGYMAPEVLNGHPCNRKCDVYSFGICLWEIYCCNMPFPNLSFAEMTSAIVDQNLRPEIPGCCPSSVANVMRRCWDASADKRPEMNEVVSMLGAIDTSKGGGMIPPNKTPGCFCFRPPRGPRASDDAVHLKLCRAFAMNCCQIRKLST